MNANDGITLLDDLAEMATAMSIPWAKAQRSNKMKKVFSLKKFLLSAFELKVPMDVIITSLRLWALDCEGLTVAEMGAQDIKCADAWLQVVEE